MKKRSLIKAEGTLSALLAAVLCVSSACTLSHGGPTEGTETGNPPVVDESLLSLVVTSDDVHITGAPGAISPGGTPITIVSSFSGETFHGTAAEDGSFDVAVTDAPLDTFEVRAVQGDESSNAVYVARGASAVTSGASEGLSCDQRTALAHSQLDAVASSADTTCTSDDDCVTASGGSLCNDSCSTYPLSKAGASELDSAREAIEGGLCKDFASDGCTVLALPCVGNLDTLACVGGTCQLQDPTQAAQGSEVDCSGNAECGAYADALCSADGVCAYSDGATVHALPACTWPADLAPADSTSRDVCHAARAYVSCTDASGAGETCLSDDPSHCPSQSSVSFGPLTCEDQCQANEYAVTCGGVGPGPIPDPPAGCTSLLGGPGGGVSYCCPCE